MPCARILRRPAYTTALLLSFLIFAQASAQDSRRQYLSGRGIDDAVPWKFFCSAGNQSGQWTTLPVPSCWDAQGFGALTYGRLPRGVAYSNEQGKYRYRFSIPADWSGQTIYLVFSGSMTDTQAWLNGHSAGPMHQGAFYQFKYDVTKLAKVGAENLLEVTVDKESANDSINRAERRGDYWNFGGIFRPVYLEARPPQNVDRMAIDAKADGSFAIDVFTNGVGTANAVEAQIMDLAGNAVGQPFKQQLVDGKARLKTQVDHPKQWTAETPNLYQAEVRLLAGETLLHRVRKRFGFRTIEVRAGDGVYVNGRRILLKGTDRHSFWPETGRATSERISRMDVALMKEMNANAVRMSHYPPDEHFLNACDEAGIYVLDELAGWHQSYDTPTGTRLIEEMVKRDVNHPCILFWDNGNEGGWNTAVDDEFSKWDPQQRHVLHPWQAFRGMNTKHYPVYDQVVALSKGPDVFMPTEFQHALFDGGGGTGLADYWEVMRTGKTSAGGFIWAFLDEDLKRKDQGGKMDGQGNQAPDGILGPYRQKEASFYTIKQIWSPIVVERDARGEFTIDNRYDFINADQCSVTCELRKFNGPQDAKAGFRVLWESTFAAPSVPAHGSAPLNVTLPAQASQADAVGVRVNDPQGRELFTWVWPLKSPRELAQVKVVADAGGSGTAKEDAQSITITAGDLSLAFDKQTGFLTSVKRGGDTFSLSNGPRLAVGDAKLAKIEHSPDGADQIIEVSYSGNLKSVKWRIKPDGWVQLDYAYELHGSFDFFGVSFDLPEQDVKSMRWLGNGPYRVWKNRLLGGTLSVWENTYNNTMTGYSDWIYPEFKGYYSGVRWMQIQTTRGPILVALDDPALYLQILRPQFPGNPKPFNVSTAAVRAVAQSATLSANAWANFPAADFSILHAIAPMGTKFNIAKQLGPQSQQNAADGEYRGSARFFFGEGK